MAFYFDQNEISNSINGVLKTPLLKLGVLEVSLWWIFEVILSFVFLYLLVHWVTKFVSKKVLIKTGLDVGRQQAATSILKYFLAFLGALFIFQLVGVDITALAALTGALGLGIGFGLQNIISNFISGIIVLFEKPIKVGDRIEVNGVEGDVVYIGARSTHVLSNDNINIIVPNSKFITDNITNWTLNERLVRFCVPIKISRGMDLRKVEHLLLEVAAENSDVLKAPEPVVRFIDFTEYGYSLELRVWSSTQIQRKGRLRSAINFAIYDKFKAHGIKTASRYSEIVLRNLKPDDQTNPS